MAIIFIIIILTLIYFALVLGLLYLSYKYIEYINKLDEEKCKCSEDMKRDMIKNFSYLILGSWFFFLIAILFCPPKKIHYFSNNYVYFLNFLLILSYGFLLFFYSKKLIEESCKCSESWVREAMQYQSYVYIGLSTVSVLTFLVKILIGNDKKEYYKILNALRN